MTFTLAWLVFAFILGAFSMLATIVLLSALWVGRDGAPALPCGGDDDDDGDWTLTPEDEEFLMRWQR